MDWEKLLEPEVLSVALAFLTGMVAIVSGFAYLALKNRSETELKRIMIERGLSADEIERVLAAGSTRAIPSSRAPSSASERLVS